MVIYNKGFDFLDLILAPSFHALIFWARELWNMVFSLLRVFWVMPKDVVELLASWKGKFSKPRNGLIWNMVPHCFMWSIWRETNFQILKKPEDRFKTWRLLSSRLCLGGQMSRVFSLSLLCLIWSIDLVFILFKFLALFVPSFPQYTSCVLWFFLYLFFYQKSLLLIKNNILTLSLTST